MTPAPHMRHRLTVRLLSVLVTTAIIGLRSIAHGADPAPLRLKDNGEPVLLGSHCGVLVDDARRLSLEDVLHARFERNTTPIPNLGVTPAAVWLHARIENWGSDEDFQLQCASSEVEDLEVYFIHEGGSRTGARSGQVIAISDQPFDDYDVVFPFALKARTACDVYIRVISTKQIQVPIYVGSFITMGAYRSIRDVIIGAYFGVMLVLLLYNLFVYFSTRDRSYLIYVVYIGMVAVTQSVFLGVARYYLWPDNEWFSIHATSIFTVITALIAVQFMRAFINVRAIMPRFDKGLLIACLLLVIALGVRLLISERTGYELMQPITASLPLLQLVMAILATRRGSRPARFFLLAWAVFLFGIVAFILKDLDILPFNAFTQYTMPLGSAVEGILLSFGLADKINILRQEKEKSQAEALRVSQENERIIREQNVVLEQKVAERTHELRESNEHLKRTQSQLVNAEKMASLGQLTAGIAHEINNPVNFISSNIPPLRRNINEMMEVLQRYRAIGSELHAPEVQRLRSMEADLGIDDSIAETTDILNSIENGAGRTAEIVRGLRNFSRLDEADLKTADINEGLRSTIAVLSPQVRDKVRIELHPGALPVVECYPGKLNQVFMNILTNAAQACRQRFPEGGGTITVRTRTVEDHVEVIIADNGPGFTPEVKSRMFEPFFTTKGVGEGTGLGLSIAYGIIEKHHGTIEADSAPGEGAMFRLVIPLQQQRSSKRA